MKSVNNKGQVTIFIIIAIVLVVAGVLIYFFYPGIGSDFGGGAKNPSAYMQSCLEEETLEAVKVLSLRGGSIEPVHYILYEDNPIGYLCYTSQYFERCVVQVPFIESHVKEEIKNELEYSVDVCLDSMKESFEGRGYEVNLQKQGFEVEIEPKAIVLNIDVDISLQKGGVEEYDSIRVVVNNNLYELVSIAQSILDWETKVGDAETTLYMNYYHHLKVEKYKQSDGTTIYIITNRNTGEKFQFASRSLAWPAGYGLK